MADILPRASRQPKLRSSCDRCGAAKLKCDRGQPTCGRCLNLGQTCVYGVSRKMGKPPRDRPRTSAVSSISRPPGHINHFQKIAYNEKSYNSRDGSSAGGGDFVLSHKPVSTVNTSWNALGDNRGNLFVNADGSDTWQSSLRSASISDFPSTATCQGLFPPDIHLSPTAMEMSPRLKDYSILSALQSKVDGITRCDDLSTTSDGSRKHDCSQEAREILHNLASLDPNGTYPNLHPALASSCEGATTTHGTPFDRVLRLNQEARERLESLLLCPCMRCPHLALLCASIVSLILTLYQQAADCTQRASWSLSVGMEDSIPHVTSLESVSQSLSSWSSTIVSPAITASPSTPILSMTIPSTPTPMAIGSFNIEDQQVQTALRDQLLLSEIRKTGRLIYLFASQSFDQPEAHTFNGFNGLYTSLGSWLGEEHARIVESLRFRLRS